jgi:4-amino-4-deoxy-L-arabinose transferase-like glycosyltransferase
MIQMKAEIKQEVGVPHSVSIMTVLTCAWPALLLATVCLLPYLNKPFLVDDPLFLSMARQIVKHPMHPMDFDLCWNSFKTCGKAYSITPGNGLMGFALVPTILGGGHEWTAHLTQLVFALIAIVAITALALWLGWDRWHAIASALLLVAIPPFLPMASTALPDLVATTLTLVGVDRLVAWKAQQKWSYGMAAAVALGLAGFARSHLVLLLPLAAFFLLDSISPREAMEQIRRRYWLWSPVAAGFGVFVAVFLIFREHNLAISPPSELLGPHHLRDNIYTYLLYFAFPLPLAVCWLVNRLTSGRLWTVFFMVALAATPLFLAWNMPLILFLVIFGGGVLVELSFEAVKKRDLAGLFLMLWMMIPVPIVGYVHLPMKYVLPCVPAVILVCFRLLDVASVGLARVTVFALIVAGTGYSLLILRSDAEFAEFGRDAMYKLIRPHVEAGERVWFPGQYWSYWYAPLAGARLTHPGGPQPKPGDLLMVDPIADEEASPLKRFPHRTLVDEVSHKYRFGRTVGGETGGLYTGFWLWQMVDRQNDTYELWRID